MKRNFINSAVLQNVPRRTWDPPILLSNGTLHSFHGVKRRLSRITGAISPFHSYLHGENRESSWPSTNMENRSIDYKGGEYKGIKLFVGKAW